MATRPVSAKTKLVHLLDGAQLDVEVGYTVVGSHVRWSARLSHDGKALGVVIERVGRHASPVQRSHAGNR